MLASCCRCQPHASVLPSSASPPLRCCFAARSVGAQDAQRTGRSTHRSGRAGCVAPGARARQCYVGVARAASHRRRSAQVAAAERLPRPGEVDATSRAYRARRSRRAGQPSVLSTSSWVMLFRASSPLVEGHPHDLIAAWLRRRPSPRLRAVLRRSRLCRRISPAVAAKVADNEPSCFAPAPPIGSACGDGVLDSGEECDDGDTDAGDGCDASCVVECGWSCTEPPVADDATSGTQGGLGASVCVASCGNGVVEPELGVECDGGVQGASLACCTVPSGSSSGCKLVEGATCCGGECCGASGATLPTSTLCNGGASHCDGEGACVAANGTCDPLEHHSCDDQSGFTALTTVVLLA